MSNLSISLTFSEDGEHLQLSRMDAAILLTWIMGGDHDNEPEETPAPAKVAVAHDPTPEAPKGPALTREPLKPTVTTAPQPAPPKAPEKAPDPVKSEGAPKREAPVAKKESAAQILRETVENPELPFSVISPVPEAQKQPSPPTSSELEEEEPYWEYGAPVEPKGKFKP